MPNVRQRYAKGIRLLFLLAASFSERCHSCPESRICFATEISKATGHTLWKKNELRRCINNATAADSLRPNH